MAKGVAHPYVPTSLVIDAYTPNDLTYVYIVSVFFSVVGVGLAIAWLVAGMTGAARRWRRAGALTHRLAGAPVCRSARRASPASKTKWTLTDRLTFLWCVACFGIHFFLEGYFALNNKTISTDMSFLGQVCACRSPARRAPRGPVRGTRGLTRPGVDSAVVRRVRPPPTHTPPAGKEYAFGDSRYITSDPFTVIMEGFTAFVEGPAALLVSLPSPPPRLPASPAPGRGGPQRRVR